MSATEPRPRVLTVEMLQGQGKEVTVNELKLFARYYNLTEPLPAPGKKQANKPEWLAHLSAILTANPHLQDNVNPAPEPPAPGDDGLDGDLVAVLRAQNAALEERLRQQTSTACALTQNLWTAIWERPETEGKPETVRKLFRQPGARGTYQDWLAFVHDEMEKVLITGKDWTTEWRRERSALVDKAMSELRRRLPSLGQGGDHPSPGDGYGLNPPPSPPGDYPSDTPSGNDSPYRPPNPSSSSSSDTESDGNNSNPLIPQSVYLDRRRRRKDPNYTAIEDQKYQKLDKEIPIAVLTLERAIAEGFRGWYGTFLSYVEGMSERSIIRHLLKYIEKSAWIDWYEQEAPQKKTDLDWVLAQFLEHYPQLVEGAGVAEFHSLAMGPNDHYLTYIDRKRGLYRKAYPRYGREGPHRDVNDESEFLNAVIDKLQHGHRIEVEKDRVAKRQQNLPYRWNDLKLVLEWHYQSLRAANSSMVQTASTTRAAKMKEAAAKKAEICNRFLTGTCSLGDNCPRLHPSAHQRKLIAEQLDGKSSRKRPRSETNDRSTDKSNATKTAAARSTEPCKYGKSCRQYWTDKGCSFHHAAGTVPPKPKSDATVEPESKKRRTFRKGGQ